MKEKNKKPDLVVWDEDRGYYASQLSYASNVGAPVIKAENVDGWKLARIKDVNSQFETRYNELMLEAQKLKDEYGWNELLYTTVKYNFQPIIGQTYHLYLKDDDSMFLSIIEPTSWKMKHIGSFKLDSNNKWNKII